MLSPTSETTPARERAHVEPSPARYARRRPDKTVLHQVVRENAEMLFAEARRRIAAVTDLDAARAILDHFGLTTEQAIDHGARTPPSIGLHGTIEPDHWRP